MHRLGHLAIALLLSTACSETGPPASSPAAEPVSAPPAEMAGTPEDAERARQVARTDAIVKEMREEMGERFMVIGKFPFAVGGDLSDAELRRLMDHTILASYHAFYAQYFDRRPEDVLRVYLFSGAESYKENAWRLFADMPTSPYGYYMPSRRSLVMNIDTGGGTLIHEMVHALMAYDFPDCPTWFSEGMGSLFEACRIGEKSIRGVTNWRLPGLKEGIAEKRNPPLRELMGTTRSKFLGEGRSLHYAQTRYFCMYLQEEGLLVDFYRRYRKNISGDPSGVATAEAVLGKKLEEVEPVWLRWVDGLNWRRR